MREDRETVLSKYISITKAGDVETNLTRNIAIKGRDKNDKQMVQETDIWKKVNFEEWKDENQQLNNLAQIKRKNWKIQ